MAKYVALLRGIMPQNPNMRNEKLRGVFEGLGFANVRTVIASGNVLFESKSNDGKKLEGIIEKALPEKLGFKSTTIARSFDQVKELVDLDPFGKLASTPKLRLNVTFLKNPPKIKFKFPYAIDKTAFELLEMRDGAVLSVIHDESEKTVDLMGWLEKTFGKEVTTRTWNTVGRIFKNLNER